MVVEVNEHIKLHENLSSSWDDEYYLVYNDISLERTYSKDSFSLENGIPILTTEVGNVNLDSDMPLFRFIEEPNKVLCLYTLERYSLNDDFVSILNNNMLLTYIDGKFEYIRMENSVITSILSADKTKIGCVVLQLDKLVFLLYDLDGNILYSLDNSPLIIFHNYDNNFVILKDYLLFDNNNNLYVINYITDETNIIKYKTNSFLVSYNSNIVLYSTFYFSLKTMKIYYYSLLDSVENYSYTLLKDKCFIIHSSISKLGYDLGNNLYKFKL